TGLLTLLSGCSGGGNGGGGAGSAPSTLPATVNDSLELLGVSTEESPRLSNDGVPLPQDFSPFGQRIKVAINEAGETHFGAPMELIVGGFALKGSTNSFAVLDNLALPRTGKEIQPAAIYSLSQAEAPWVREDDGFVEGPPVTLRDSAGGDLDGDGHDELIIVYTTAGQVSVRIANLANRTVPEETLVAPISPAILPVGDVRLRAADLDGDGHAEIILAISQAAASGRPTFTGLIVLG